jgi:DNA-binding CsgD family transcriptional regulator
MGRSGGDRSAYAAIRQSCASGLPPLALLQEVSRHIRQVVPYAAAGWQTTDPVTLLPTGGFAENVDPITHLRLIDNELTAGDFVAFTGVARSRAAVATLSQATGGDLARSARHRTINAPAGWCDELRAVFRSGGAAWGQMCLARADGEPAFSAAEATFLSTVARPLGDGLRSGLLLERACSAEPGDTNPGLIILQDDGTAAAVSDDARGWLAEMADEGLEFPSVVYEVARRARLLADTDRPGPPARARVRLPSGRWFVLHGSRLRPTGTGRPSTAVMIEPAHRTELAPLLIQAYELTPREREITGMLVRGVTIADMATALWLSPHTIRDHVKAVFAKLGVRSRPELTAMLFYQHHT